MSDLSLDDAEFWLPAKFHSGRDSLIGEEYLLGSNREFSTGRKTFPAEFPYDFDLLGSSSELSSPLESVVDSTETESSDEEEDFLAGLTRRLTLSARKSLSRTSSPELTLAGVDCWSSSSNVSPIAPVTVSSPKPVLFDAKNNIVDLIHQTAGEVERLKMNNEEMSKNLNEMKKVLSGNSQMANPDSRIYSYHALPQNRNNSNQFIRHEQPMNQHRPSNWGINLKSCRNEQENHWINNVVGVQVYPNKNYGGRPPLQQQHHHLHHPQLQNPRPEVMRAPIHVSPIVSKPSSGTGVFLPRKYNNNTDSRKKSAYQSPAIIPPKIVHPQNQPRVTAAIPSGNNAMMSKRNAGFIQQNRNPKVNGCINHARTTLPHEWTYLINPCLFFNS